VQKNRFLHNPSTQTLSFPRWLTTAVSLGCCCLLCAAVVSWLLLSPGCCCLLCAAVVSCALLLSPGCWSNEARLLIGWFRWWLVHWLTVTGCRAQPARRWPLAILVARTAHKFEQHHPRPLLCSNSPQGRVASTLRTIDLGWVPKPVYCPLVWSVYCPLVWSVYCPLVWSGLVGLWSGRSIVRWSGPLGWSVYWSGRSGCLGLTQMP